MSCLSLSYHSYDINGRNIAGFEWLPRTRKITIWKSHRNPVRNKYSGCNYRRPRKRICFYRSSWRIQYNPHRYRRKSVCSLRRILLEPETSICPIHISGGTTNHPSTDGRRGRDLSILRPCQIGRHDSFCRQRICRSRLRSGLDTYSSVISQNIDICF